MFAASTSAMGNSDLMPDVGPCIFTRGVSYLVLPGGGIGLSALVKKRLRSRDLAIFGGKDERFVCGLIDLDVRF